MVNATKTLGQVSRYSKYLAVALVAIGIPTMFLDSSAGSELPLMAGLFILLVTRHRDEDERSMQIKMTSLYIAFVLAYAAKLVITNLHGHGIIAFQLTEINHFIITILVVANAIFYTRVYFSRG